MLFSLSVVFVSFFVGYAMKRGGLCTYAAVVQIVNERRFERMMVFLGVAAWATLIILPLHWIFPSQISLSFTHNNLLIATVGGAILGLGAFLNRGCFFGTFVALVSGNINYIATLIGLSFGVSVTYNYLTDFLPNTLTISYVYEPTLYAYLWLIFMTLFALFMSFSILLSKDHFIKKVSGLDILSWKSVFSMITIGIGGVLLYATVNGWNYSDVLTNTTFKLIGIQQKGATTIALLSTISLIIGGITAAVVAKQFVIRRVNFFLIVGCFTGGAVMGSASMLIPGGNDGLLLKGIPSLAPHALGGYLSMLISMWVLVYIFRNRYKA